MVTEVRSLTGRWPTQPLSSIVDRLFVGLPVSRNAAKQGFTSISAPVLSVSDIEDGRISPIEEISRVELRSGDFERFRVQPGDILVSCRGTLLKTAMVLPEAGGVLASSNIITIRANRSLAAPQLILTILRSAPWQETIRSRTRSSTGLMQLTVKDLEDLPMPVPPLAVQGRLAEIIDVENWAYRRAIEAANARHALVESFIAHALLGPIGEKGL
jgi:hypothetical protein